MTLEEHHKNIQAAINAAREAGYWVTTTSCCCDQWLVIEEPPKGGRTLDFDTD